MQSTWPKCDDLTDEESEQADDCALEIILREIVNNQNAQIQAMRAILEAKNYPQESDCKVPIGREGSSDNKSDANVTTSSLGASNSHSITINGASFVTFLTAASVMLALYMS
eukprot:scaffold11699_cov138-Skeletonema_dohrnii-CCMP3373.AAC.1